MKRFLALAALVLGLAACQTEPEGLDVIVGGEVDTVVSVSLPEATRANSAEGFDLTTLDDEGSKYKLRYILEIYRVENGITDRSTCQRHIIVDDATNVAFPVRLAPNHKYQFVAWADIVETDAEMDKMKADRYYNTANGLDEISIIKDKWVAMDETRDAFTAKTNPNEDLTLNAINLELRRPFAKLRVVATDYEDVVKLGLKPTSATVEYSEKNHLPLSFDALTGDASNAEAKSHNTISYATPVYDDENGEFTLFADYFFVPASGTAKFSLNVYADADLIKANSFNTEIFVEANKLTTIKGDVLTTGANINIDIENGGAMDGTINEIFAGSSAAAQAALDNAVANTTIHLEPGVNYGTLYLRPINGGAQTKVVDWLGNNYGFETYSLFENLTIVGAEGATIDAIKIEGGTYYHTAHSQSDLYPVMLSLIELKNVVFDGVTFTGKGGYDPQGYGNAVNLSGNNIKVDGLTLKNCVLNNSENNARLLYKTESTTHVHNYAYNGENFTFTPSLKDITINGCTFNGGYMGLELRETENVTITNNVFNVADRNILLPVNDDCTYSGNITITGNVSNNAKERFVRADGTGDAVVVIRNNTINNYLGADADYIKVTNGNNVTIKDNTISIGVTDTNAAQAALDNATDGDVIQLQPGVNYGTLEFRANPGHSNTTEVEIADAWRYNYVRTIENVKIIGAQGAKVDGIVFKTGAQPGDCNNTAVIKNLTIEGVEFTDAFSASNAGYNAPIMITTSNATIDGLTVKNCKLIGDNNKLNLVYLYGADGSKNVTLSNNTVDGIARLCELRGTENVTIKDNTIKNTYEHAMLLAGSNYSGRVTITGNTAEEIHDRFVRMAGAGDAEVVIKDNTIINYRGTDADYIKVTDGNNVTIDNNVFITTVATADELKTALENGGNIVLAANFSMTESIAISNANFVLDGNGYTITMADNATNAIALFDITGGKADIKNVTFDGIKNGAVVRTVGTEFTAENVTAKNGQHIQGQGLFRLMGKSTIKNCSFKNNTCSMVITLNFDGANNDPQVVENCVFEGNTCNGTAVLYYVTGAGATINGNKFIGNTVNCNSNGATVYMGFTENNVVTNNLFQNNTVNEAAESSRVAGGVFFGYETVFTGNAFVGNNVTGTNAKGNDVCVSTYYTNIDLSGNYWGGDAPVEDNNYFVQHKSDERVVIINDYLTSNPIQ